MKREERKEFNYIKRTIKQFEPGPGMLVTICTDASAEYKSALHSYYESIGFHPAAVKTDSSRFDEKERIIYIYGLSFDMNGVKHPWTELYTETEKERFKTALL